MRVLRPRGPRLGGTDVLCNTTAASKPEKASRYLAWSSRYLLTYLQGLYLATTRRPMAEILSRSSRRTCSAWRGHAAVSDATETGHKVTQNVWKGHGVEREEMLETEEGGSRLPVVVVVIVVLAAARAPAAEEEREEHDEEDGDDDERNRHLEELLPRHR
eukprot:606054-Rhodomonas_salina.1